MQSKKQELSPVLCDEIIEEILSWLPVKSLIQFKCVSKGWNSLMSDPSFIKLHLRKSAANEDLDHLRLMPNVYFGSIPKLYKASCTVSSVFHSRETVGSFFDSHDIRDSFGISILNKDKYLLVGSCNGLHCVVSQTSVEYHVRLWNTATRVISGKSPSLSFSPGRRFGRTKFGFGYDPLNEKYKVVALSWSHTSRDDSPTTEVKLYGMGDSCWTNIQGCPFLMCLPADDGVYLSGTVNWVGIVNDGAKVDFAIISVDLGNETCRLLYLPDDLYSADLQCCLFQTLGVLRNSLCIWRDFNCTNLVIWQMKNFGDYKSWIRLMNFQYSHLNIDPDKTLPLLLPLFMSKNGDMFMLLSTESDHEYRTILYNPRDGNLKCSIIPSPSLTTFINLNINIFAESLVMPY